LSLEEISDEFFSRFLDMLENGQADSELIQSRHSDEFSGCTHAEASTLMGLFNYYSPGSAHTSFELGAELQDPGTLQDIIQPARSLCFFEF